MRRQAEKLIEGTKHSNKEADERLRQKKEISNQQHQRDLNTGESHLELSLPSFEPPGKVHGPRRHGKPRGRGRPSARHGPHHRQTVPGQRPANRRTAQAFQDYDPRAEQARTGAPNNIFPIPVEFLNQIQGGPGKFRPNEFNFNPSAQIEELNTGDKTENDIDKYSFVPEEGIQPTLFTLEEGVPAGPGASAKSLELPASPTVRSLPPVSPITTREIYREEYPSPGVHTPYSQVPYHDARHTTPSPANIKVSKDKVLHYMAPPNQVTPAEIISILHVIDDFSHPVSCIITNLHLNTVTLSLPCPVIADNYHN